MVKGIIELHVVFAKNVTVWLIAAVVVIALVMAVVAKRERIRIFFITLSIGSALSFFMSGAVLGALVANKENNASLLAILPGFVVAMLLLGLAMKLVGGSK